jgi:hydroxyacylglutathione hydrolase
MTAATILKSRGWENFREVEGGYDAIKAETSVPRTDFVCAFEDERN